MSKKEKYETKFLLNDYLICFTNGYFSQPHIEYLPCLSRPVLFFVYEKMINE